MNFAALLQVNGIADSLSFGVLSRITADVHRHF